MIANLRRLVIVHIALGLASVFVYWARPGTFIPQLNMAAGRGFAFIFILKVFLAWIPYILSGLYSCDVLAARDPKATIAFISFAVGIAIIAACLNLNLFGMRESPSPLLVFAGVTIALIAAARLCAAIWRSDVPDWDSDP